jgi:large subunit ribosomal protein L32e
MTIKFLRRDWHILSKLGKKRKKKQTWRRPTGRDNKMREKRRGYPAVVSLGYKKDNESRGKIKNKIPVIVKNINDLKKVTQNQFVIIGKIGKKKRIEIEKLAKEKKIEIHNLSKNKINTKEKKNELKK